MTKTYTPAVFQPTIRPSWAGAMKYIPIDEKADILEAIVRFPENDEIDSAFWQETILPDLQAQYKKFVETCEARGRGAKTYWGEHKLSISSTYDKHKDNLLKDKDNNKDKVKDNNRGNIKGGEECKEFEDFWNYYTPIKATDGHFVAKGNKKSCQEKFNKIINKGVKYETIINGLKQYLTYCKENGMCSCGAEVFLNQRRWENDYSGNGTIQSNVASGIHRQSADIMETARQFAEMS